MNKLTRNITALCLCGALCLGAVGVAFAAPADNTPPQESTAASVTATATAQQADKDETVYVLAEADGAVQRIIVSDWLRNALGSETITDSSDLTGIENVKGDGDCTASGGVKVWDTQGNDIYYRGDTEKELPVAMTVSYWLDGEPITPEALAGKSGRVTIRFDYDNRQYEQVRINGREEQLCVPFVMLTGMLLDNDTFRNVEVSNGKRINDGDHTVVMGLALPGLQENLNLSRDTLDLPDYVEVTADVTDFRLGMTVTIATNSVFSELDRDRLDGDDLTASLDELTDAMEQLLDGSSQLYDGLCTLLEESGELVSGVDQLADGAGELNAGADELAAGAETLRTGTDTLSAGLKTLSANSADLNSGAEQVFQTLLATATTQIRAGGIELPDLTISSYAGTLTAVIASLDEEAVYQQALQQVTEAVEAQRPLITQQVTAAVEQQVTQQVTAAVEAQVRTSVTAATEQQVTEQVLQSTLGMSREDYDAAVAAGQITAEQQAALQAAIDAQLAADTTQSATAAAVASQMATESVRSTIAANTAAQMESDTVQSLIARNVEAQVQQAISDNMQSEAVQAQLAATSQGARSIIAVKESLDSYNAFYLGVLAYTAGVDAAASGAEELSSGAVALRDGTAKLKSGAAELYSGMLTLQDGMPDLTDGITRLRDGAMELSDGLEQFNEEGIQKLVELLGDELDGVVERLRATIDVSRSYRNFSGIADGMDGQVKFIYRTDEINS